MHKGSAYFVWVFCLQYKGELLNDGIMARYTANTVERAFAGKSNYEKYSNSESGTWTNSTHIADFKFDSSGDCSEYDLDCDVPFSFQQ